EVQGRGRVVAEVFRTRDQVLRRLGMEHGQPLVEPPLVEQGGLVVEELGDGGDEPTVAHADVSVAETRPVNDRRCQPSGDHETTSQETVLSEAVNSEKPMSPSAAAPCWAALIPSKEPRSRTVTGCVRAGNGRFATASSTQSWRAWIEESCARECR